MLRSSFALSFAIVKTTTNERTQINSLRAAFAELRLLNCLLRATSCAHWVAFGSLPCLPFSPCGACSGARSLRSLPPLAPAPRRADARHPLGASAFGTRRRTKPLYAASLCLSGFATPGRLRGPSLLRSRLCETANALAPMRWGRWLPPPPDYRARLATLANAPVRRRLPWGFAPNLPRLAMLANGAGRLPCTPGACCFLFSAPDRHAR